MDMIWPLGLIVQGLTSTDDQEIRHCLSTLQKPAAKNVWSAASARFMRRCPSRGSL